MRQENDLYKINILPLAENGSGAQNKIFSGGEVILQQNLLTKSVITVKSIENV